MEKYIFHSINDTDYIGIITILDYEINLSTCLSDIVLPAYSQGKKILIDLALKSGLDQYRYVSYLIGTDGRINLGSYTYINISQKLETLSNSFLNEQREIVINSILTESQKRKILNMKRNAFA